MNFDCFSTAMMWKTQGIATIPIRFRDKRPDSRLLPDGDWLEFQTRLPTDTELATWFAGNLHNIGLVVGWRNLVVIDFDNLEVYARWLLWAARRGGITQHVSERSYQVKTARGMHVYVYLPQPEQTRKLPGVDIKAQRGYVLIPPSVHPSGVSYLAINPGSPIIMVEALSDVLPADMLSKDTEYLPGISPGLARQVVTVADPWASAEQALDPSREMVTQVRERHSILDFLNDVECTSQDKRWYRTRCPFHDDKQPSFWIDTKRGICGCYGACTPKPLDVINLVARLRGITNREAILWLSRL